MTVGSNRHEAYQDVQSPAVGILDAKIHINSIISDVHKGASYCTADITDFFLCSTMQTYQYICIHHLYVPAEVLVEYNLTPYYLNTKSLWIFWNPKRQVWTQRSCHIGLWVIERKLGKIFLPFKHTPGMWRHNTHLITFTLSINDLGVKYFSKDDTKHLSSALQDKYSITTDWYGSSYLGIAINCN